MLQSLPKIRYTYYNPVFKEQGSLMSTPVVTCCHLWHSVGCSNHQAYYISSSNRNTCIQVPRFFPKKKISGLRWESNPHLHISGVMLYQLSYQALLGARWWGVGYTSVVSWCPLHLRNKVLSRFSQVFLSVPV